MPPDPSSPAAIKVALDSLKDQRFITDWRRQGRRWVIVCGATFGPYTTPEAYGFVEGARAMGAAI